MKIYIDSIVFNFQKIGGISVYITNIISRLIRDRADYMLIEQNRVKLNILRSNLSVPDNKVLKENILPLRLLSYMPIRVRLRETALIHSSYYRICKSALAVNIITVYDFNYELGYVRQGIRKYLHCRQKKYAVENADGVICISESTKRDLLNFYKNINPDKITVIHLAAGDEFYRLPEFNPDYDLQRFNVIKEKKYVLFVGSRTHHKNFDICIETIAKTSGYELVIVGNSLSHNEILMLDEKLPARYHAFSNVPANELNYLYNNAFCFFYPTSYEGFGIPVLEAMQAGCPVVSTNISSIPEVAGNAALLVDKVSSDGFVDKITSLENTTFRDKVICAGLEQAKKFSWDKTYRETVLFYNHVYHNKVCTKVSHLDHL